MCNGKIGGNKRRKLRKPKGNQKEKSGGNIGGKGDRAYKGGGPKNKKRKIRELKWILKTKRSLI